MNVHLKCSLIIIYMTMYEEVIFPVGSEIKFAYFVS